MIARLRPVTWDRDTGPIFAAAREGRLIHRHCNACGRGQHPPTVGCRHCGSVDTTWRDAAPRGRLWSWTVVATQAHPAYPAPYAIVVVELDDAPGVRMVGSTEASDALAAGVAMEAWFEDLGDGVVMPNWRVVHSSAGDQP